jgi:trigger factor
MQTAVETLPEDRVRLTVEVPAHDVDHAFEHALRDLAKDVRIPGFRKGKVPAKVVLAHGGNLLAAARALHVHPNTLYHRLGRIEELTGRDVRDPDDAFELQLALRLAGDAG